jgi:plasmid stability protein
MTTLVIQDMEDEVRDKLQTLAHAHGRTIADEVMDILKGALARHWDTDAHLGTRLANRFSPCGLEHEILELRSI